MDLGIKFTVDSIQYSGDRRCITVYYSIHLHSDNTKITTDRKESVEFSITNPLIEAVLTNNLKVEAIKIVQKFKGINHNV